jgi:chemotaxis protein histidine kinase CheA
VAAFRVDAEEFLRLFIHGLQPQAQREDTLQALGNAAEALRGIRIGADFLRLDAISALCRQGEQDLLRQLPHIASGGKLQWDLLRPVIDGLQRQLGIPGDPAQAGSTSMPLQPLATVSTKIQPSPESEQQTAAAPEPEPEPEPVPEMELEAGEIAVQTARVGAWVVAVPAAWVMATYGADTPQWVGPLHHTLVVHDDIAVPTCDLAARWALPGATDAQVGPVLMLRTEPQALTFGLRVDAVGTAQALRFWPLPAAVQARCGVRAAAWPGQPPHAQPVLLLDARWLQSGEHA